MDTEYDSTTISDTQPRMDFTYVVLKTFITKLMIWL